MTTLFSVSFLAPFSFVFLFMLIWTQCFSLTAESSSLPGLMFPFTAQQRAAHQSIQASLTCDTAVQCGNSRFMIKADLIFTCLCPPVWRLKVLHIKSVIKKSYICQIDKVEYKNKAIIYEIF